MKHLIVWLGVAAVTFVAGSSPKDKLISSAAIDPVSSTPVSSTKIEVTPSPNPSPSNKSCGIATYYDLSGITANGETFDPKALTAAHPSLPFGSVIQVVDQHTGLSVKVRINDRGPWIHGYMLDLTPKAMRAIDPKRTSDLRQVCIYW